MALESEHGPEQISTEDRRTYRRILWGFFAFYSVVVVSVASATIAGSSLQKATHFVLAAWTQNGCTSVGIVAPSTAIGLAPGILGTFSHSPSWNELSTTSRQRS